MRTQNMSSQIQVGLELFVAPVATDISGEVNEFHVLAKVGQVAIDFTALFARSRVQRVQLSVVFACNKQSIRIKTNVRCKQDNIKVQE